MREREKVPDTGGVFYRCKRGTDLIPYSNWITCSAEKISDKNLSEIVCGSWIIKRPRFENDGIHRDYCIRSQSRCKIGVLAKSDI